MYKSLNSKKVLSNPTTSKIFKLKISKNPFIYLSKIVFVNITFSPKNEKNTVIMTRVLRHPPHTCVNFLIVRESGARLGVSIDQMLGI